MIKPKYEMPPVPTSAQERDAYELVTLRDGNTCQRCRRDCGPVARDHRKNRSQGGLTVLSNLHLLGLGCHTWKTEHPKDAVDEGWAVPAYGDPAEWPARRYFRSAYGMVRLSWVIYGDDGSVREISEQDARERMESMGWRAA